MSRQANVSFTSTSSGSGITRMPRCDHCHQIISGAFKCVQCEFELCYACFLNPSSSSLRLGTHSSLSNDTDLPTTTPSPITATSVPVEDTLSISGGDDHIHRLQYPTRTFDRPCDKCQRPAELAYRCDDCGFDL
jgi:predicted RNA-binding Zn-ribbon protein involved in translation (DUF1610 family)